MFISLLPFSSFFGVATLLWLATLVVSRLSRPRTLPLPPGPRALPIIGNLHQAPKRSPWKKYREWSRTYGPIFTLKNGSALTIVFSSAKLIKEHLERKNTVYSHRPYIELFDRVNGGLNASIMPYGPRWKAHRTWRTFILRPAMTAKYAPVHDTETRQLLHELLAGNDVDFAACYRRCIASIFLTLAYGERLITETPEIQWLEELNARIFEASEFSYSGADVLWEFLPPAIKSLFPFPSRRAAEADKMHEELNALMCRKFRNALLQPAWNWCKEVHENPASSSKSDKELAFLIGSLYEAALTPYHALRVITLAAMVFPTEAARAYAELDEVVGADRLPTLEDIPQLPLTMAFVREALRWRGLSPLGASRAAFTDDECTGYRIPRDAIILINQWAVEHDESIFPEPFEFRPERWLVDSGLPDLLFGFGQRACPGRHMGQDAVSLAAARVLWAFDIVAPEPLDLEMLMESANDISFISLPADFQAAFRIRSPRHRRVVEDQWTDAEKDGQVLMAQTNIK
nr:cytochrome P450 AspF [Aspergillus sp.]